MTTIARPTPLSLARPTDDLPKPAVDALRSLEAALTAPDAETVAKVNAALGFRPNRMPNAHLGETATYLTVWSQMDLDDIFRRVGGTVTIRQVERSASDGTTWTADEITLTVDVPDVGYVEVVTDIEDDPKHGYRTDVPVVAVARYEAASKRTAAISKDLADPTYKPTGLAWDDLAHAREVMTGSRDILAAAGMLELIGGR